MNARSQLGLFDDPTIGIDSTFATLSRTELPGGAWLEYGQGFLRGHEALMQELVRTVRLHEESRVMYERTVAVPRLVASLPADGPVPRVLELARRALGTRYDESFDRLSLGYYRSGQDSVAWHGDYVARKLDTATVATISLGEPRAFFLRPKGGGSRITLRLGWGDLLVMGGTCQRTWEHAVPKAKRAGPRLAVMFRPIWIDPSAPFSP
jgi:alkylated DNA repair dioxygenase AlkB